MAILWFLNVCAFIYGIIIMYIFPEKVLCQLCGITTYFYYELFWVNCLNSSHSCQIICSWSEEQEGLLETVLTQCLAKGAGFKESFIFQHILQALGELIFKSLLQLIAFAFGIVQKGLSESILVSGQKIKLLINIKYNIANISFIFIQHLRNC